jgi:hypothetical protein
MDLVLPAENENAWPRAACLKIKAVPLVLDHLNLLFPNNSVTVSSAIVLRYTEFNFNVKGRL